MFEPIKMIDIELSEPLQTIKDLEGYIALKALVRLHGVPLGYIQLPIVNGCCSASAQGKAIIDQHAWPIMRRLINNGLTTPPPSDGLRMADLLNLPPPVCDGPFPLVTVAVCTRDRSADLALCLKALCTLEYPNLDLLVIDNAPSDDQTERLVREQYPQVRYICEPRPGLNWARNRAILEAQGEIIAYTDDDVIVDSKWVSALAQTFAENPEVMAVTGLVVPYEFETEAQIMFEIYGGFGRGFERTWNYVDPHSGKSVARLYGGTGRFGTGANMAYRRYLFDRIGCFDPALDVGTVTNGGGDLEMFFRVLKEGYTLVYEPRAMVFHRHRREYARLHTQITNNGIGFYAYLVRSLLAYPDERKAFIRLGLWWLKWWNLRRLWQSFFRPTRLPRELIWAELKGSFAGLGRYQMARRTASQIAEAFGPQSDFEGSDLADSDNSHTSKHDRSVGVCVVELSQPLQGLADATNHIRLRIYVTWKGSPLGSLDITNQWQPISASRLREAIINHFGVKLLDLEGNTSQELAWMEMVTALKQHYIPISNGDEKEASVLNSPPESVSVSVVVATFDRPDDLRECLQCLTNQKTKRSVEIIVVDNHPQSGLTEPVVADFPGVVLVRETRQGLSYARNAGITASIGQIIICTDDDTTMPPDWLEKLIAPFGRPDVMIVTGNVLPVDLSTPAQRMFEKYGGLGRGFEMFEVGREWFESYRKQAVPTWDIGATANAAFRAKIFSNPQIGLLHEALGAGSPTGCSEDTYTFYQVLKAGYTIVYQPAAYVWHKHRRDLPALRKQIYNYSKGHIAYHLLTLFNYHDLRALQQILLLLPKWHIKQIFWYFRQRLFGKTVRYPLSLTLLEIKGNLFGPWALWRSLRRVKREGHSRSIAIDTRNIEPVDLNQEERSYLTELT